MSTLWDFSFILLIVYLAYGKSLKARAMLVREEIRNRRQGK
jgi:hypothetical protein